MRLLATLTFLLAAMLSLPAQTLTVVPAGVMGLGATPSATASPLDPATVPSGFDNAVGVYAGYGVVNANAVDVYNFSTPPLVDNALGFVLNVYELDMAANQGMAGYSVDFGPVTCAMMVSVGGSPWAALSTFYLTPDLLPGVSRWTSEASGPIGITHAGRGTVVSIQQSTSLIFGVPLAGLTVDFMPVYFVPNGLGGHFAYAAQPLTKTF